jgi:hypothetical protein
MSNKQALEVETGFAISYDGTYSRIIMVKKRDHNDWVSMGTYNTEYFINCEVFPTFSAAKKNLIEYFQGYRDAYQTAIREARAIKHSTVIEENAS